MRNGRALDHLMYEHEKKQKSNTQFMYFQKQLELVFTDPLALVTAQLKTA